MVVIALLTFTADCSPKKLTTSSNICRPGGLKPTVTVADSSHLLVGWDGVFLGCAGQNVTVILDDLVTTVQVEEKSTSWYADPCLKHTVVVKLPYEDTKHKVVYNENTFKPLNTRRYGGLLEDVRQSICRNTEVTNLTDALLDIPERIGRCILSGNEVNIKKATQQWEPDYFQLKIVNPDESDDSLTIDVEMERPWPRACACKPSHLLPEVWIANSSHLGIHWNGSFTQCNNETINSVTVTLDNQDITTNIENMNHYIPSDPCENHTILVTLNYEDESTQYSTEMFHVEIDPALCQAPFPAVALILVATLLVILIVVLAIFCNTRSNLSGDRSQSQSTISTGSPGPLCPGQYTPIIVHHVPDASYLPNYQQG